MSAAKRTCERRARRGSRSEPFAWLRCDALLAAACSLSPGALQVYLLLHANWTPTKPDASAGAAVIPYTAAAKSARRGRSAIAAALRELQHLGLLTLVRAGTRPQSAGGARGEAAVYDLPLRHRGQHPRADLPPNVRRPQGKVAWHAGLLRRDVKALSGQALKVLVWAVARRDRDHDNTVVDPSPFALPAAGLSRPLGLSRSAVARATAELVRAGRFIIAEPAKGRRPATYCLHRDYLRHQRRADPERAEPTSMVSTRGPRMGRNAAEKCSASVLYRDANP